MIITCQLCIHNVHYETSELDHTLKERNVMYVLEIKTNG